MADLFVSYTATVRDRDDVLKLTFDNAVVPIDDEDYGGFATQIDNPNNLMRNDADVACIERWLAKDEPKAFDHTIMYWRRME